MAEYKNSDEYEFVANYSWCTKCYTIACFYNLTWIIIKPNLLRLYVSLLIFALFYVYPRLVLNPDLNAETLAMKICWKKFRLYHVVVLLLICGTSFSFLQSYFPLHFLETLIPTAKISTIFTVNSIEGLTNTNGYDAEINWTPSRYNLLSLTWIKSLQVCYILI